MWINLQTRISKPPPPLAIILLHLKYELFWEHWTFCITKILWGITKLHILNLKIKVAKSKSILRCYKTGINMLCKLCILMCTKICSNLCQKLKGKDLDPPCLVYSKQQNFFVLVSKICRLNDVILSTFYI